MSGVALGKGASGERTRARASPSRQAREGELEAIDAEVAPAIAGAMTPVDWP